MPWSLLSRRTVRLRLTVLYGGLFLVSGAGLLAFTYLVMAREIVRGGFTGTPAAATSAPPDGRVRSGTSAVPRHVPGNAQASFAEHLLPGPELHRLLTTMEIALGIMAVVALLLGWLVAGRVLRPLRVMTASTRRISSANLHERLALSGPRDELTDLADTIDGLVARLEESFEAQRRFVANASHELRTPLAMMRTSLDVALAKPEPAPPQLTVLAGKLREGLDQADGLVEGFLTLARAQHGELAERTMVPVSRLAGQAIRDRERAIADKRLRVRLDAGDVQVHGNETLLSRMVGNVIDNAVRHNEPGGWFTACARDDGTWVRFAVESGGPRLAPDKVARLGQPFRRLGADRTGSGSEPGVPRGTGLGLSIVAAVATAHGGSLHLQVRAAGGLRVVIELPSTRLVPADAVVSAGGTVFADGIARGSGSRRAGGPG